jgi:hypothetical protein
MNDRPPIAIKSDESQSIEAQTEAFLSAGGAIDYIETLNTAETIAACKASTSDFKAWNQDDVNRLVL